MVALNRTATDDLMDDRSPIPAGWYQAILESAEGKESRNTPGNFMLACTFSIVNHPEYANRKVYENINLWNQNEQAQGIANRFMNSLQKACRMDHVQDSDQLVGIPMDVKIGIEQGTGGYADKNKILALLPLGQGAQPAAPQQAAAPAQPMAPPVQPQAQAPTQGQQWPQQPAQPAAVAPAPGNGNWPAQGQPTQPAQPQQAAPQPQPAAAPVQPQPQPATGSPPPWMQ